ncbi:MAG: hypothetical protein RI902_1396 [Pseudomonadota bacterium]|jgi:hypothetical protein
MKKPRMAGLWVVHEMESSESNSLTHHLCALL